MDDLNIGKKLQELRQQNNLSVRKLASASGITSSMLSQIENDQVNPSINTLRALAAALNTPLYHFFRGGSEEQPIVTPDTRKVLGRKNEPGVTYELLTPDTRGAIECCMMAISPNSSSNSEPHGHLGEEVAFLYSGESVELIIDGIPYILRQGDSVRIPAKASHVWNNHHNSTVQVLFSITPPSF